MKSILKRFDALTCSKSDKNFFFSFSQKSEVFTCPEKILLNLTILRLFKKRKE